MVAEAASLRDEYVLIREPRRAICASRLFSFFCCCYFFGFFGGSGGGVGGLMHNYLMRHVQGHPKENTDTVSC